MAARICRQFLAAIVMGRFAQKTGERGSLKWIQHAVNERPDVLNLPILAHLRNAGATTITWMSPRRDDDYAEYRDGAFLGRIKQQELVPKLTEFWPSNGPQWDALGIADSGDVLLVEAKAHIPEIFSDPTGASPESKAQIERAMKATVETCGAEPRAAWTDVFYQLGNRLAHLKFLRDANVRAWLVLVNFIGDKEMGGPETPAEWEAAYAVAFHVMGLRNGHPLSKYIVHLYPAVAEFTSKASDAD